MGDAWLGNHLSQANLYGFARLAWNPELSAERIAEEWWLPEAADDVGALRDYYRVEDEEGRRFWLFRAGLYSGDHKPRWFIHGVFS